MTVTELINDLTALRTEFGDLDITSDAAGDGSILGVEVVRDTHVCQHSGCGIVHETEPRAIMMIDSDCRDC